MTRQSEQLERDRSVARRLESLDTDEVVRVVETVTCELLTPAGRRAIDACRLRGRVLASSRNGTTLKALQVRGVLIADMYGVYRFTDEIVRHLEQALKRPRQLREFLWLVTAAHRGGGRPRQWIVVASSAEQALSRLKDALADALAYEEFADWSAHPAQCSVAFEIGGNVEELNVSCVTAPR